jgi:hypothetical protein
MLRSRSRYEGRKISKSGRGVFALVGTGAMGGSRGSKSAMRRGFPELWSMKASLGAMFKPLVGERE